MSSCILQIKMRKILNHIIVKVLSIVRSNKMADVVSQGTRGTSKSYRESTSV